MRDPLEGLSESATIETGADLARVADAFRPVHDAVVAMVRDCEESASVDAYGSVVTGQVQVATSQRACRTHRNTERNETNCSPASYVWVSRHAELAF